MDMQQQIDDLKRDLQELQVIVAAILVESASDVIPKLFHAAMGQDDEETIIEFVPDDTTIQ